MVLSAEIRWLLACVRSLPGQEAPSPPKLLSWDRVLAIAEAEGLAPALASAVKTKGPTAVPAAVRERLHRRLADGIAGQLILGRELGRLLRLFEREGVPVIPLKGPALADARYERAGASVLRRYLAHYRRMGQVVSQAKAGLVPQRSHRAPDRRGGD
jgi:hypothetical protein